VRYRNRADWGAQHETGPPEQLPAAELFIHHSVTVPTADPDHDMRQIEGIDYQRFGMGSYSWAVHPDGTVLEGEGLLIGAHTLNHNSHGFGVVFIGNYMATDPTAAQLAAAGELIAWIRHHGWLNNDAPIRGHRDVRATACPGDRLSALHPELRRIAADPYQEDDMPLDRHDLDAIGLLIVKGDAELSKQRDQRTRRLEKAIARKVGLTDAEIESALTADPND
jgi:hypothetical protein